MKLSRKEPAIVWVISTLHCIYTHGHLQKEPLLSPQLACRASWRQAPQALKWSPGEPDKHLVRLGLHWMNAMCDCTLYFACCVLCAVCWMHHKCAHSKLWQTENQSLALAVDNLSVFIVMQEIKFILIKHKLLGGKSAKKQLLFGEIFGNFLLRGRVATPLSAEVFFDKMIFG